MRRDSLSSHIVGVLVIALVIAVPFLMAWLSR
jgi:sorbitol-specific phosphotransferase system component IIBC